MEPNYTRIVNNDNNEELDVLNSTQEDVMSNSEDYDSGDESVEIHNDNAIIETVRPPIESDGEQFKDKCLRKLSDKGMLRKLVDNLDAEGNLYDFVLLMKQLSSGELPANNIVLQLLLDRVRFQKNGNTVGMRYRKVTKLFWSVVYRLCKGVGLKFFGGEKNWGQVVTKISEKSKYSPSKSKINFAVPDEKVLRDFGRVLPKFIPPGKIQCTMDLL